MLPLRLVIDTNILVSAALKPDGLQRTVILLAITKPAGRTFPLTFSRNTGMFCHARNCEFERVFGSSSLTLIENRARLVSPSRPLQVTSDPDDNIFLECADAARADYLITGNQKHFPRFWKKTKIITSREFISLVAPHLIS
jgi:putative PIN family toxin of toxin-antitoxin system